MIGTTENQSEIMTVAEVAAYLRVSLSYSYELVKRKDFPSLRLGRAIRVDKAKFHQWCKEQLKNE